MLKKDRVALDSEGEGHDMIELAAGGYVPEDLIEQIEERVPPEARTEFELGFATACQDHVIHRDLGLSEN